MSKTIMSEEELAFNSRFNKYDIQQDVREGKYNPAHADLSAKYGLIASIHTSSSVSAH